MLYLSVFPSAVFLFAPYTEALFLALAVWTLYLARRGLWGGAGAAAFLAGLTRTQGCLLALPLAWELVRQWREARGSRGSQGPQGPQGPRRCAAPPGPAALVPLLPLHGLLAFLTYSHTYIGWTTFQALPEGWGYTPSPPWTLLALSWQYILRQASAHEALNLGLLLLTGALLLYGLRRLPFAYTLYAAPHLLLIATRQTTASPLASASRYVLVLFPAFVALALLGRHRRLHSSWLLLSTLLLAFLLTAFVARVFVA